MKAIAYGVGVGFAFLILEAGTNGLSRLFFNTSINSWVSEKMGGL